MVNVSRVYTLYAILLSSDQLRILLNVPITGLSLNLA